jgi:citrate lyase subunit beta/citryl-CoA lyase
MTHPIRPRRSVLYMPASNARAVEKSRTLPVDALILDLEDAVAPDAKHIARDQAVATVRAGGFSPREVAIRVNALASIWGADDLAAVAAAGPDAILLPKVSSSEELLAVGRFLAELGAPSSIRVWAMIETPLAILAVREIAAIARDPLTRLELFVLGTNDLARETRAQLVPGRLPLLGHLTVAVAAARAYGLDVIDGVYNDIEDMEGFARECAQGRELGFDGKTVIHPRQIEPCNAAFSPTADEIAQAERIVALFEAPENRGKGALALDGRMVERLHADIARRTLALAAAIAARDNDEPAQERKDGKRQVSG